MKYPSRRYLLHWVWLCAAWGGLIFTGKAADTNVAVRFGIVTDVHYADAGKRGTRVSRESMVKLAECVKEMNRQKVEFLIELGDLTDKGKPADDEPALADLKAIEAAFAKFKGPRYHVLGNHDLDSLSKKLFLANVVNTGIPADRSYYAFARDGIQFVVLDADFGSDGTPYDHGNIKWQDTNIPEAERAWLRQTLAGYAGKSVVFAHQRLDAETDLCVKGAPQLRKLLSDSGKVLAVFCGHDHKGGLKSIDGIHYYTLKAMGEGSGPEKSAYAVVEVRKDDSIKVTGFHKADSATLP